MQVVFSIYICFCVVSMLMFRITCICGTLLPTGTIWGHARRERGRASANIGKQVWDNLGTMRTPKTNKKAHMASVGLFCKWLIA